MKHSVLCLNISVKNSFRFVFYSLIFVPFPLIFFSLSLPFSISVNRFLPLRFAKALPQVDVLSNSAKSQSGARSAAKKVCMMS